MLEQATVAQASERVVVGQMAQMGLEILALGDVLQLRDVVQRRTVVVVATQDGVAVVSRGLASGERIVVEGQYRLTDGAKVKIGAPQQAGLGGQAAQ